MHLYDPNGRRLSARKTRRPRFSQHRGRTWDVRTCSIDGQTVKFHYDSTWGMNFYFQWQGEWRSASLWDVENQTKWFTSPPASPTKES